MPGLCTFIDWIYELVVLKNTGFVLYMFCIAERCSWRRRRSLGRGELGDGLGSLGYGVLGQLAGEDQAHSGLDLAGGDSGLLGIASELSGLGGDLVKHVVDEGVEDAHGLGGDAGVGVDLLEDLVQVDLVGLGLGGLALLLAIGALLDDDLLLGLGGLCGSGSLSHLIE